MLGMFHFLGRQTLVSHASGRWQLYARGEGVCYKDETLKSNPDFCFIAKLWNIIYSDSTYKCTKENPRYASKQG